MPLTIAIIRELWNAGLRDEPLFAALERIVSADICGTPADKSGTDQQAERRRERDRLRKSAERLRKSADNGGTLPSRVDDNNLLSSKGLEKELPLTPSVCGQADIFETLFWPLYPKKVGKGGARRAFKTASGKTSVETILEAVKLFAASCAGKDANFIPHPATWLNDERWQDATLRPNGNGHAVTTKQVPVIEGSPAWKAWNARRKYPVTDLHIGPGQVKRGWYFPTEFPPQQMEGAA